MPQRRKGRSPGKRESIMKYEWKHVGVESFEYRRTDDSHAVSGKAIKEQNGYRAKYIKGGLWQIAPDLLSTMQAAKMFVETALQSPDVANRADM
jgi:hypothetical protein